MYSSYSIAVCWMWRIEIVIKMCHTMREKHFHLPDSFFFSLSLFLYPDDEKWCTRCEVESLRWKAFSKITSSKNFAVWHHFIRGDGRAFNVKCSSPQFSCFTISISHYFSWSCIRTGKLRWACPQNIQIKNRFR